ncbi:hypothetical protein I302_103840 [Kwoniella bestiolae CBS 10118]|uniref:Secreted protein n=1 Tax=Kwoniella bestiolae CBS 10118 TaxID=1296100 RepID=A0A1B9G9J2_9TREE|nr:hypothetical protein I302_02543 [Kwoniella bestiolae CBS 10118]OCF27698.1 hypothetical protein I302_02543 [Kwoniella bestiolae CBS 10118]
MLSTSILTVLLSAIAVQQVMAQAGETFVLSRDGTTEYTCPSIEQPETYYQDKCLSTTKSGKALTKVEVRNGFGSTRDDWSIYQFCYYGTGPNDYCSYYAYASSPSLTRYGTGLDADCPTYSNVAYKAPDKAPVPAPSTGVAANNDGWTEPLYVCPNDDGDLYRATIYKQSPASTTANSLAYECEFNSIGSCFYKPDGTLYTQGDVGCPVQLCTNHYDPTFTRRKRQNPDVVRRQVKASDLRRALATEAPVPKRADRFTVRPSE